jgi:hypothetical protein
MSSADHPGRDDGSWQWHDICMVPTPEEMENLIKGAPIYLTVIGNQHPPVFMSVGLPPE